MCWSLTFVEGKSIPGCLVAAHPIFWLAVHDNCDVSKENLLSPIEDKGLLASELVNARAERGWSQADLSEKSGVSKSALKAYETGRNLPGSRELLALCSALETTPDQLLLGLHPSRGGAFPANVVQNLTQDFDIMKSRLSALVNLLTRSEFDSLFTLARGIAISRHSAETVTKVLREADLYADSSEHISNDQLQQTARTVAELDGREHVHRARESASLTLPSKIK